jgi:hypothetical protein
MLSVGTPRPGGANIRGLLVQRLACNSLQSNSNQLERGSNITASELRELQAPSMRRLNFAYRIASDQPCIPSPTASNSIIQIGTPPSARGAADS